MGSKEGISINEGYPQFQLVKALRKHNKTQEVADVIKAEKWNSVLELMFSGELNVGSRKPLENTPTWVTLEVLTGGFATGNYVAGGELQEHEVKLAKELGLPNHPSYRGALNGYFLSEDGYLKLVNALKNGCYSISVPEEGALLVVVWLLEKGNVPEAQKIIDEIAPFFEKIRFYPKLVASKEHKEGEFFVQPLSTTLDQIKSITPNEQILAQIEAVSVWGPLYDRVVSLLLETCEGDPPTVEIDNRGKPKRSESGSYYIQGSNLFETFPPGWSERAIEILETDQKHRLKHRLCGTRVKKDSSYSTLINAVEVFLDKPENLTLKDKGYCKLILARSITKHGLPDSAENREYREKQYQDVSKPLYSELAAILSSRIEKCDLDKGIYSTEGLLKDIEEEEEIGSVSKGDRIPVSMARKLKRSQIGSIGELVEQGLISSPEVLAKIIPQISANISALDFDDASIRGVYSQVYCAFRRRRSLLLLNLESQVKIDELPWVSTLAKYRSMRFDKKAKSLSVAREVMKLSITYFPHVVIPNKLLQEIRFLLQQADKNVPLVDEVAADIFMGVFSPKFSKSADIAQKYIKGTVYSRYYNISEDVQPKRSFWKPKHESRDSFSEKCQKRAGKRVGSQWSVSSNGKVIEQQQILTTQNLAQIYDVLELEESLNAELEKLVLTNFSWVINRLQIQQASRHAKLISIKNSAYAWRQMVFFLALMPQEQHISCIDKMSEIYEEQNEEFQSKFSKIFLGLRKVLQDKEAILNVDQQFLGWTSGEHQLL